MVMLVGDEPMQTVSIPLACAGSAFVFIFFLYTKLWSAKTGKDIDEEKIDELSLQIKSGAIQFLKTEYDAPLPNTVAPRPAPTLTLPCLAPPPHPLPPSLPPLPP